MKLTYRIILIIVIIFLTWISYWALFSPKKNISEHIYQTLKEQEKKADLTFKQVIFEETSAGVKYWQLEAQNAVLNKNSKMAVLQSVHGTFFREGKPVLSFQSPTALWDMGKKEIFLDQPFGYSAAGKNKYLKSSRVSSSTFNLPSGTSRKNEAWFRANALSWKLADQKLFCEGKIIIHKGNVIGYGEKLSADVEFKNALLEGYPRIEIGIMNENTPVTLEALKIAINSKQDVIAAQGNPVVYWEEAKIQADKIQYAQRLQKLNFTNHVKITYKDISAWADAAIYWLPPALVDLLGNARATQGDDTLNGQKVRVLLKEKKVMVIGKSKVLVKQEE